ncbi:MAG: glycosyltransferase [Clostridiaceae bacterium]
MKKYKVSVIIPLASNDTVSIRLNQQLSLLPNDWEILFCSPKSNDGDIPEDSNIKYIITQSGRANCLNEGVSKATGKYLWFLHSDSFLSDGTVSRLTEVAENNIPALYYFDLAFYSDGCWLMKLNELGAFFRSRVLKTPFGDQGFFINKDLFDKSGNYSTDAEYGEDHLLVRKLRKNNIPIKPIGMKLFTSARKYETYGWLKTTMNHLYLWRKQARSYEKEYRRELKK